MRMVCERKEEKRRRDSTPFYFTPLVCEQSVAEAAVIQRGRDIHAHAVIDGALRGDLLQIEGLRQAVDLKQVAPQGAIDPSVGRNGSAIWSDGGRGDCGLPHPRGEMRTGRQAAS